MGTCCRNWSHNLNCTKYPFCIWRPCPVVLDHQLFQLQGHHCQNHVAIAETTLTNWVVWTPNWHHLVSPSAFNPYHLINPHDFRALIILSRQVCRRITSFSFWWAIFWVSGWQVRWKCPIRRRGDKCSKPINWANFWVPVPTSVTHWSQDAQNFAQIYRKEALR